MISVVCFLAYLGVTAFHQYKYNEFLFILLACSYIVTFSIYMFRKK
jgi:hypothetical protein